MYAQQGMSPYDGSHFLNEGQAVYWCQQPAYDSTFGRGANSPTMQQVHYNYAPSVSQHSGVSYGSPMQDVDPSGAQRWVPMQPPGMYPVASTDMPSQYAVVMPAVGPLTHHSGVTFSPPGSPHWMGMAPVPVQHVVGLPLSPPASEADGSSGAPGGERRSNQSRHAPTSGDGKSGPSEASCNKPDSQDEIQSAMADLKM